MKLLIQPDDGVAPLVRAISGAKKSIEIMIFRFAQHDIEKALVEAIHRGVTVQALIASNNRGGANRLRSLEARLLAAGATVARTSDELVRHHGKFMIVDRQKLFVLGFNFTRTDLEGTRSFGVVTPRSKMVQEAAKLFSADRTRQPYTPALSSFIVSPSNSRQRLAAFLKGAKKELLIYDVEVSDRAMIAVLKERAKAGVDIRIIGQVEGLGPEFPVRASHPLRLHARVIVRDRQWAFLGSQSLRRIELDTRREVGLLFRHPRLAAQLVSVFQKDWETASADVNTADRVAKKVAKAVARELVDQVAARNGKKADRDTASLEQSVKDVVKTAVREAVQEVVAQDPTAKG